MQKLARIGQCAGNRRRDDDNADFDAGFVEVIDDARHDAEHRCGKIRTEIEDRRVGISQRALMSGSSSSRAALPPVSSTFLRVARISKNVRCQARWGRQPPEIS